MSEHGNNTAETICKDYEIVWNESGEIKRERYNGLESSILDEARKIALSIGGTIPVSVFLRTHVASVRLHCVTELAK